MPDTTLLSIRNVSNVYTARTFGLFGKKEIKPVLNKINLELHTGEIFGLTGKSGCGKTTLANCILGLTNYKGEIYFDGHKLKPAEYSHNKIFAGIQMVFQDPGVSVNPVKKIGQLIEEPLIIHKIGSAKERSLAADEILYRVGLEPSYKLRRAHELSGGQKQRVCLARSLILKPRLLIADEAISSLDVCAGAQILNLFRELNKSLGLSILFISHNNDAIEYLCDRSAVMEAGQIASDFLLPSF